VEVALEERHEPGENENQGELVRETVRRRMRFSVPGIIFRRASVKEWMLLRENPSWRHENFHTVELPNRALGWLGMKFGE